MSLDPIPAELFGGGHLVHLATLRPDGAPQSRPLWTIVHEGNVVFFTQATSPKARDVGRDPRVALSVTDKTNPYRSAWLRGRVSRVIEGDEALAIIDLISKSYIGGPFPMRSGTSSSSSPRRRARPSCRSKTHRAWRPARSSPLQVERAALPTSSPPRFSL